MLMACVMILLVMALSARVWMPFIHAGPGKKLAAAQQIAQNTMEKALANKSRENRTFTLKFDGRTWRVEQDIIHRRGVAEITVHVKPIKESKWMISLYTEAPATTLDSHWSR